jgi:hypothetical protein
MVPFFRKKKETKEKSSESSSRRLKTFRVKVPLDVQPGEEFQAFAANQVVRLKCPRTCQPGQYLSITLPADLSSEETRRREGTSIINEFNSPNVQPERTPQSGNCNGPYMVTVPQNIRGGQQFPVTIAGTQMMVTCPMNVRPGMIVRIVPPKTPTTNNNRAQNHLTNNNRVQNHLTPNYSLKSQKESMFRVVVPEGVEPGSPFSLIANGIKVMVTCPPNASPGQTIKFHLPFELSNDKDENTNSDTIARKLDYDVDGWTRTLRLHDMKFQWVRLTKNQSPKDENPDEIKLRIQQYAYVRYMMPLPNVVSSDLNISNANLVLVPAQHGVVESNVVSTKTGKVLANCTDLIRIQAQSLSEKTATFERICKKLGTKDGTYLRIKIRRQFLLQDSIKVLMSLEPEKMHSNWRFEFLGEEGVDAGGVKREWFYLISEALLDPDGGLWKSCGGGNQMCLQIHPSSSKF